MDQNDEEKRKKRAHRLRDRIAELIGKGKETGGDLASRSGRDAPESPRDFIHRRMREQRDEAKRRGEDTDAKGD